MSVRQYIGARYIPIFADPIQWDNTSSYEPLTVVMNLGTSYVSKQSVPAGIDIDNEDYWIAWADYNAQIEAYRTEVAAYNGRIEALENGVPIEDYSSENTVSDAIEAVDAKFGSSFSSEETVSDVIGGNFSSESTVADAIENIDDKIGGSYTSESTVTDAIDAVDDKIGGSYTSESTVNDAIVKTNELIDGDVILIGDSYAAGWTPDGDVTSWSNLVATYLSGFGINCYHTGTGGAGFATSTTYKSLLQTLVGTMTQSQIEQVKTIVFCGGANDRGQSEADITTGMSTTKAYVLDTLPNIKRVLIANVGMVVQGLTSGVWANATFAQMVTTSTRYNAAAISSGLGAMIPYGNGVLRHNSFFSSDYVHPNQLGQKQIAQYIISALSGIDFANSVPITYVEGFIGALVENSNVNIYATRKSFSISATNATFNGTSAGAISLGNYTRNAALQMCNYISIPCVLNVKGKETSGSSTTKYFAIPGSIYFYADGTMKASGLAMNATGNNFLTVYDIEYVEVSPTISDYQLNVSMDRH